MTNKSSKINSTLLSFFWIGIAWIFISIIHGIIDLSGFSYSMSGFSILNFVKRSINKFYLIKGYWPIFLLLTTLSFYLGIRSSKSPSFAKYLTYTLGLVVTVVFLLAWLFLSRPCEGLGCMGHGIVLLIEAGVFIVVLSILPISAAYHFTSRSKMKVSLLSTIRPGVLIVLVASLMLLVPLLPNMSKTLKEFQLEQDKLLEAKRNLKLLEPANLPGFVNPERSEDEEKGGVRYSYICNNNNGYLNIIQVRLDKVKERISETKTKYKTNPNYIKNLEKGWIILENIFINDSEGLYFHDNLADKAIWETDNSQITIEDFRCLDKQELIKIAVSMGNY